MYLERLHIVTACLLGRFPSGETSQRTDVIDAELYVFLAEGRNVRFESAAHFELWHQVFPDVQDYVCIAHHHQAHDRRARSHQLAALGEDSGYLSVFGSSEPGVHKKGGNFIHRAACGIYKATCGCAVFALRAVHSHLILLVCRAFGSLCGFVHGFYFVLSLRSNYAVLIKGEDALIGGLGKRQVALRLIPKLQGCGDNLPARSGINLFVLFLRHLFQSIYLTVFGFDSGTVDDNERVTRFYPISLLYEERIYTPRQFSADAYLRGFYLPLQHHWLPAHK